jgi:hypothetical protein
MTSLARPSRIGRRALLAATAILIFDFMLGQPRRTSALQSPSNPTLLVRGETRLDGAPMAWRVVSDVAEVGAAADFERRALGFAVATNPFTTLLLTDEATGSAYPLSPGDAAFVREGTMQRRESLAASPDSYLRMALVKPSAASDAGGDRLRFAGPAFPTPTDPVTLSLHRVELSDGESFGLAPSVGETETLVLVEQGEVELEVGEGAPREHLLTVVGSDTAYAIRSVGGSAMLYSQREGTRVLVAQIA